MYTYLSKLNFNKKLLIIILGGNMKDLRELNFYRNIEKQKRLNTSDLRRSTYGIFDIPLKTGITALTIADNGVSDPDWEHISVSTSSRCLTWDEMCEIKNLFFNEDEVVIQIHPAKKDYVNFYEFCLHLWKPKKKEIPLPPAYLVY